MLWKLLIRVSPYSNIVEVTDEWGRIITNFVAAKTTTDEKLIERATLRTSHLNGQRSFVVAREKILNPTTSMQPKDFSKGIQQYWEFHQLEPKKVIKGTFSIPPTVYKVGEASYTNYRSDKWENKSHDYTHDHESGVSIYVTRGGGKASKVPDWILKTNTLVKLGDCIGFGYLDEDDVLIEAKVRRPYPELYCTPDGKCLLVIQNKQSLQAIMWGGYLDVTERGIVG